MSGLLTAAITTLVMTPLDLVVFNQMQTRLYGPKSLKRVKFGQIIRELKLVKGLSRVFMMAGCASLARNMFVITLFYCADNYLKNQLIKE